MDTQKQFLIVKLRNEGKTYQQIRDIVKVGNKFITRTLREHNLMTFNVWGEDNINRLEEMIKQGLSDTEISVHFGVAPATINKVRHRKTGYRRTTDGGRCGRHGSVNFYNINRKRNEISR